MVFTSSSLPLSKFYNHGFKILIFVQKIKAQIDEELNHENIVLPQRTTPRKTAQKATQQETFAQRQNKTGGRNAGKQNRR